MFAVAFAIEDPKVKVDLTSYFVKRPPGVLHCTTKYTEFGKAPGAEEYAQQEVSTTAPAFPAGVSLPLPSWGSTRLGSGLGGAALLSAIRQAVEKVCPYDRKVMSMGEMATISC